MSCDKFIMLEGSDSFRTWQGLKGAHFTPHVNEDGLLTWTNDGNLQNPAPTNIRGPAGQGLQISGIADSIENLPDSQPIGSVWLVGDDSPYEAYAFFGEWIDIGEVQVGPQGPKGDKGDQGDSGQDYILTNADKAEISALVIANTGIGDEPLETEATTVKGAINELYEGKVDKVTGKGLSTNDYSNAEKDKVATAGTNITDLQTRVGTAALDTTNKNLSGAVNELKQNIDSKVSKDGDTITGDLAIQSSVVDMKKADNDVSATTYLGVNIRDKNGYNIGRVIAEALADGSVGLGLWAYNRNASGTQVGYSAFRILMDKSGNVTYIITDPQALRAALGLGTDGTLPITIAQGGTGQTSVSSTTTVSDVIASTGSGITIAGVNYCQWGKVAMFDVTVKLATAVTTITDTTVATLVSNKRPKYYASAVTRTTGANNTYIATDGAIHIVGTLPANTNIHILSTYILA